MSLGGSVGVVANTEISFAFAQCGTHRKQCGVGTGPEPIFSDFFSTLLYPSCRLVGVDF